MKWMHHVFAHYKFTFLLQALNWECKNGILSVSPCPRLFDLPTLSVWSVCLSVLSNNQSFCLLIRCFAFNDDAFCLFVTRLLVLPPFNPPFCLSRSVCLLVCLLNGWMSANRIFVSVNLFIWTAASPPSAFHVSILLVCQHSIPLFASPFSISVDVVATVNKFFLYPLCLSARFLFLICFACRSNPTLSAGICQLYDSLEWLWTDYRAFSSSFRLVRMHVTATRKLSLAAAKINSVKS